MTVAARTTPWISPEEFLAWEAAQEARYEYVEGEVFGMAEASPDHGRIAINIGSALRHQLRGKPCEAFMETMKVKIPPLFLDAFYYPDVVVVCDPADKTRSIFENPAVIFEVLSPSTEHKDLHEKTPAYMHLPSLQFFGVVSQERRSVIVRERTPAGWRMEEFTQPGDRVKIGALGCELTLAEIYERVSWHTTAQ